MSDERKLPPVWGKHSSSVPIWKKKEDIEQKDVIIEEKNPVTNCEINKENETVPASIEIELVQSDNQTFFDRKDDKINNLSIEDNINEKVSNVYSKNRKETKSLKNRKSLLITMIVLIGVMCVCVACLIINQKSSEENDDDKIRTDNKTESIEDLSESPNDITLKSEESETTIGTETVTETPFETETMTEIETTINSTIGLIDPYKYSITAWISESAEKRIYISYATSDLLYFDLLYERDGALIITDVATKLDGNVASFVWSYQLDVVKGNVVLEEDYIMLNITESSLDSVPVSKENYYKQQEQYEEETVPESTEQTTTYYEEETSTQSASINNIVYDSTADWSDYVGKWSSEKVVHTHGNMTCYDVVLSLELYEDNSMYYKMEMCNGNGLYRVSRGTLRPDGDGTYSGNADYTGLYLVELGVYDGRVHFIMTNTYNIWDWSDALFDLKIE